MANKYQEALDKIKNHGISKGSPISLTLEKECNILQGLIDENQDLAEALTLYNEKFAGHERIKTDLIKENKALEEANKELKNTYDNLYNDIIKVIQEIKDLTMEVDTDATNKNSEDVFKAIKNIGWNEAIDTVSTKLAVRMSIHIMSHIKDDLDSEVA